MDQLLTLMPCSGKYGRFNVTAAFSVAAALLALLAPNLLISVSAYVHGPISYRAAAWQSHDHGVVGPPLTSEAEFKHLRLNQTSSDLRTLVLGSSRGNYSTPSPERVYAVKSAAYANIEPLSPCK